MQNLLKEGIPIRDLPIILEAILEYAKVTKNPDVLTEYVRHSIGESIKKLYQDTHGVIHAIALDPRVEQILTNALQNNQQATVSTSLGLAPDVLRNLQNSISQAIDDASLAGFMPVIITPAQIRPYFQRMIRTTFPMTSVISYTELPPDAEIEIIETARM